MSRICNQAVRLAMTMFPLLVLISAPTVVLGQAPQWVVYPPGTGAGQGKSVVLISGDEEYRSEEVLPALGKILARHHGFRCTVLFAIDPKTGEINPEITDNIPGLAALEDADLMVIFTRFRNLPDEQMKYIDAYVQSGKPIIGMRTATHAFNIPANRKYAKYGFRSKEWPGGFGRQVLGETWINHHGHHGRQSTRGIVAAGAKDHPIMRGIHDGDVWGPTDVYGVRLPLPEGCQPLLLGQVLRGMKPDDPPVTGQQNDPMMPIAWTRHVRIPGSPHTTRVFTTTMGAAQDFQSVGLRRMLVQACYWCVGLENKIDGDPNVELVGKFHAVPFGFGKYRRGLKPADFAWHP